MQRILIKHYPSTKFEREHFPIRVCYDFKKTDARKRLADYFRPALNFLIGAPVPYITPKYHFSSAWHEFVEIFQTKVGLMPTGNIDYITWRAFRYPEGLKYMILRIGKPVPPGLEDTIRIVREKLGKDPMAYYVPKDIVTAIELTEKQAEIAGLTPKETAAAAKAVADEVTKVGLRPEVSPAIVKALERAMREIHVLREKIEKLKEGVKREVEKVPILPAWVIPTLIGGGILLAGTAAYAFIRR